MLDLVPATAHHTGTVGEATIHIMEAKEMWASALAALEKEPLCLVDEVVPGSENHSLVPGSSVSRAMFTHLHSSFCLRFLRKQEMWD